MVDRKCWIWRGLFALAAVCFLLKAAPCTAAVPTGPAAVEAAVQTEMTLRQGRSKKLSVSAEGKIRWYSADKSIASVSSRGKVTARKKGRTVIKAKSGGKTLLRCVLTVTYTRWDQLQDMYAADPEVRQLLFVRYQGGSLAKIELYTKKFGKSSATCWKKTLTCTGYVGKNGIDKKREGDVRTPTGDFALTSGFGIKPDPGAAMDYVHVNKYLYWCADKYYYNQLIDIREHPHKCLGEHLINYVPHYNYGMFLDFNSKNEYKKGSAIFLHCTGKSKSTHGCIAVPEDKMIRILKEAEPGARICIYRENAESEE